MVKIAVVQFDIKQFDPETNLKEAKKFIKSASGKADIIVFPEQFLTGPLIGRLDFADDEGYYRRYFTQLAIDNKIAIVPGSFIEKDNGKYYNTSYYIDSRGEVLGKYRKINLWLTEKKHTTPGEEITVFKTDFGKIGLCICWDLSSPQLFQKMAEAGADVIICPSFWWEGATGKGAKHDKQAEVKHVNALCEARAFENKIALVYCNAAGSVKFTDLKDRLVGRSQITLPFKGAIKRFNHNRRRVFIEYIDKAILDDARFVYAGKGETPSTPRVVVDTNVFVAAKFNPKSKSMALIKECITGKFHAVYSQQVREEVEAVVFKIPTHGEFHPLVGQFFDTATQVKTFSNLDICRDAGDNRLLECAIDGKADFVVTSDRGVLEHTGFRGMRIVNVPGFYEQARLTNATVV